MAKAENLIDQKFGRLLVVCRAENDAKTGRVCWGCVCDCGNIRIATAKLLKNGHCKSCGCLEVETRLQHFENCTKHGQARREGETAEYRAWRNMINRCYNPNVNDYELYGGRGVTVCERWLKDFEAFFEDMGEKPAPEYSIDRKDPYGDYTPENCRWADKVTQSRNTRKRMEGGYKNG